MVIELSLSLLACPMRHMAGVTTHVQGSVTAPALGNVLSNVVAGQAKIARLVSRSGFEKLILVFGSVRIMALEAVANGGLMDLALDIRRVLLRMTGEAECLRGGRCQFDTGDVFVYSDLMTSGTSGRNRGMNRLAFRLVLVAFDTFRGIGVLVQGDRMLSRIQVA